MAFNKNVFILGAGASASAGVPVLNDFLKRSRELIDNPNSKLDPESKEAFKRVFEWRGKLYSVLKYLKVDLENMETLFCLVDMAYQLGVIEEENKNIRNDLIRMIARTIDLTTKFVVVDSVKSTKADEAYNSFIQLLVDLKSEKSDQDELDSIITLNYDIACEQAFKAQNTCFTYDESHNGRNNFLYKLLKLHGSVNWVICSECRNIEIDYDFNNPNNQTPTKSNIYHIEVARKIFTPNINSKCKCGGDKTLCIVPPTWNKTTYSGDLLHVWKSAREELEKASRIIIIGYSLPETDSFFKYLLALGLSRNESLQEIIVINPAQGNESEALRKRYLDFIAPYFDNKNFRIWRVKFGYEKNKNHAVDLLRYSLGLINVRNFNKYLHDYEEEASGL